MVNLANCDKEPIHRLGKIQSFGCLLAFNHDWQVEYFSENAAAMLGLAELKRHQSLDTLFNPQWRHTIRSVTQSAIAATRPERAFQLRDDQQHVWDIAVYPDRGLYVLEFEPGEKEGDTDTAKVIREFLGFVKKDQPLERLLQSVAFRYRLLTGFDRVMIYQFLPDDCGEVVAEATSPGVESFLGLRYPASDIPKQARQLYLRNLLRLIADVSDPGVAILPGQESEPTHPLDLSDSVLRAVSPIHILYLKNMGVAASMSASIIVDGKLWGLIACHHFEAKILSLNLRTQIELITEVLSLELSSRIRFEHSQHKAAGQPIFNRLLSELSKAGNFPEQVYKQLPLIKQLIDFSGALIQWGEQQWEWESVPDEQGIASVLAYLNSQVQGVFATDCLVETVPQYEGQQACGVLAIPLSHDGNNMLLLFRDSASRQVSWAGNPNKPVENSPEGKRLMPRSSFAAWQQEYQNCSKAWSSGDIFHGENLRFTLLEVLLEHIREQEQLQREAQKKQDVLIAELNHRVRNILTLVKALANQSRVKAQTLEDYVANFSQRIFSLANAHDLLAQSQWNGIALRHIVETEFSALGQDYSKYDIQGPDVHLTAAATTACVLVMHELLTNAVKHGAIAQRGQLAFHWSVDQDGLNLQWSETGISVKPQPNSGFGHTVIEQIFAFELGAEVDYQLQPERVQFSANITNKYFRTLDALERTETEGSPTQSVKPRGWNCTTALIVEDSLLIAMDLKEKLHGLGIEHVEVCASVSQANRYLDQNLPDIAVLDVNLGEQTSELIAERLNQSRIPYLVATGYGYEAKDIAPFKVNSVIAKPYDQQQIESAIAAVMRRSD